MDQRIDSIRTQGGFVVAAGVSALVAALAFAGAANAAPRTMTGSITVENPSAGFELAPGVYGKPIGGVGPNLFPPTAGAINLEVEGATATTSVGRGVTLPASVLNRSGFEFRDFPAFANVAQVSKSFMTVQGAATFAEGQGALAACPGPGCTASGTGTSIEWCPPATNDDAISPAPGTANDQIGNWDCSGFGSAGAGNTGIRLSISNASGRPNFGGTLTMIRNQFMNVWRVPSAPSTPDANDAQATRSLMNFTGAPWSGGQPNFDFTNVTGTRGPLIFAQLNGNGAIEATFGCVNGTGTVGGSYMQGSPVLNLGNNCGTGANAAPGQGWGFKMTTGTISGSDAYPNGLVVTTVAGTPFNPVIGTQPVADGFFFSRMGTDAITGMGNRNLVMLGGGVSFDPSSFNAFFRTTQLSMNLSVPEPATGLGLLAGAGLLVGFARRRFQA